MLYLLYVVLSVLMSCIYLKKVQSNIIILLGEEEGGNLP